MTIAIGVIIGLVAFLAGMAVEAWVQSPSDSASARERIGERERIIALIRSFEDGDYNQQYRGRLIEWIRDPRARHRV